jgi:hypothetical protein
MTTTFLPCPAGNCQYREPYDVADGNGDPAYDRLRDHLKTEHKVPAAEVGPLISYHVRPVTRESVPLLVGEQVAAYRVEVLREAVTKLDEKILAIAVGSGPPEQQPDGRVSGLCAAVGILRRMAEDAGPVGKVIRKDETTQPVRRAERFYRELEPTQNDDEWVRCSHPHCPNAERFAKAPERGWQHGHMDTWLCPEHRTDGAKDTASSGETTQPAPSPDRRERYAAALREADTYAQLGNRQDLDRFVTAAITMADTELDPVYRSGYRTGRMHAGGQPTQTAEACANCRWTFNPDDTRFNGHARHRDTPFCRCCVDRCHDSEIADHQCAVCRTPAKGGDAR